MFAGWVVWVDYIYLYVTNSILGKFYIICICGFVVVVVVVLAVLAVIMIIIVPFLCLRPFILARLMVDILTIPLFKNPPNDGAEWRSKPGTREPVSGCAVVISPTRSGCTCCRTPARSCDSGAFVRRA